MLYTKKMESLIDTLWTVERALDLWCGQGWLSVYCADAGILVDAVDNSSLKNFLPWKKIRQHTKIKFYNKDIYSYLNICNKTYDLIILSNVLPFLKKDFIHSSILPFSERGLAQNWSILFSYFLYDDPVMSKNRNMILNNSLDFENFMGYRLTFVEEFWQKDNHPPIWEHNHHIWIWVLKKTSNTS